MTTDTQLAPTDAELDALIDQHRWDATTGRRAIARAVLARWGAQQMPASAAEFALQALVAAGHVSQELVDRALALPGAPTPATRKPLTDEQIEKLREATFSTGNPFCPCDSKTMRKAVRAAERAHGIKKGGQHGAE